MLKLRNQMAKHITECQNDKNECQNHIIECSNHITEYDNHITSAVYRILKPQKVARAFHKLTSIISMEK